MIQATAVKGGTIKHFAEVPSGMDCNTKCTQTNECLLWVYSAMKCLLKTDNTFGVHNSRVTSERKGINGPVGTKAEIIIIIVYPTTASVLMRLTLVIDVRDV